MVVALHLLYSFVPNELKLTVPHMHWGRCSKSKEKLVLKRGEKDVLSACVPEVYDLSISRRWILGKPIG